MESIYDQFRDFKSFEVVFLDFIGNPQKLYCSVRSIGNDSIVIDANNEKNKNIFADVGAELKLHIYTDSGIYTATSKVVSLEKGLINTEYVIAYPANSKHSQRREYFRADMSVDFKMRVIYDKSSNQEVLIEAKTKNVCGKGMSFVWKNDIEKYDSIELELHFADKVVKTAATLVYSKQILCDNRPKFILAFSFNDISTRDVDYIVKQCFLQQLALRKKQIG